MLEIVALEVVAGTAVGLALEELLELDEPEDLLLEEELLDELDEEEPPELPPLEPDPPELPPPEPPATAKV